MENWALVIGINEYWRPEACLNGAVPDAEAIYKWLLRPDGGSVPASNLYLLLSPTPSSLPVGVQSLPALRDNIVKAISELIARSGGQGDRFFFYFAGHGLSTIKEYALSNGIVATDFTDILTTKAISLDSIFKRFQATQFREQLFFIDACRNIPFKKAFRIGDLDEPGDPIPPFPSQFIMYATSLGLESTELVYAGNEQGAFTSIMMEGLAGAGSSKVFDDITQEYLVTWESLFRYVEAEVKKRKIGVSYRSFQEPKESGEHGTENPILGRFSPGSFANETLEVSLTPEAAASVSEVVVNHFGGEVARQSAPANLPIQFSLEPRMYSLRWTAKNYRPMKNYEVVPLYSPTSVNLQFDVDQSSLAVAEQVSDSPTTNSGDTAPSPVLAVRGLGEEKILGTIEIRAEDPLAKLVLLDNSGTFEYVRNNGSIYLRNMAPGFYRARLYTPEGRYSETLFELSPGETENIVLDAPPPPDTPLFKDVTQKGMMLPNQDNTIEPSEAMGPTASVHLSTILALAGGAVNEKDTARGYKLRQIGVRSFQDIIGFEATSGVQILFGVEAGGPTATQAYLSQVQLACWSQSETFPRVVQKPFLLHATPGLAEFAWQKSPGAYWLSIQVPDQRPVAFSVAVLPDRLTLIVFIRTEAGEFNIYQYLPALTPGDPRDPRRNEARFPILQRSELIQRSYLSGHLEEPDRNAEELIYAKCVEPVAGALGGYILLNVNPQHQLLSMAVRNMMNSFGGLSDSHVLNGAWQELISPPAPDLARQAYRQALETGIPIFAEGLERLIKGLKRLPFEHPQLEKFHQIWEKRVSGLMWAAVPVDDL